MKMVVDPFTFVLFTCVKQLMNTSPQRIYLRPRVLGIPVSPPNDCFVMHILLSLLK